MALGRDGTHVEVCTPRHGAHVADEPTRVVVALGDPVTGCLAGTGRRDGRGVCSPFEMAEDLAHDLPLRDDGVDRKSKSPFGPAGVSALAPSVGRHGTLEAVGED